MKRFLIGIDEAGYGPKIGPLVIGASVWLVPADLDTDCILDQLSPEFQSKPWQSSASFLPLGDSKAIFRDKKHLDSLRHPIRFLLDSYGCSCDSTSDLIHNIAGSDALRVEKKPWYGPSLEKSPWERPSVSEGLLESARAKLQSLGIEFRGFMARILDEEEFNNVVHIAGNKANALGDWSLTLLRDCIAANCTSHDSDPPVQIEACCDRQGGRKHYLPLLNHAFQEWKPWFDVVDEANQCSRYRGRMNGIDLRVRFQVHGDSMLPTGVASMLAKLVRELLMQRLNKYWQEQVGEGLKPTAGYPVDAERFRRAIEKSAVLMNQATHRWWRCS